MQVNSGFFVCASLENLRYFDFYTLDKGSRKAALNHLSHYLAEESAATIFRVVGLVYHISGSTCGYVYE